MSVQLTPSSLDKNTCPPPPVKPEAVITTWWKSRGDTATDVSGRPATPLWSYLLKTGPISGSIPVTQTIGPVAPSELVTR